MLSALRKIGNSTGLIIPKAVLQEAGLSSGTTLDLRVENGGIVAKPVEKIDPRAGWAEDAARIGAEPLTEDEIAWLSFGNEADDEWTW